MNAFTAQLDRLWPTWKAWIAITRIDKPVGSLLLLWPTLWALWIAAEGVPSVSNLIIFTLGVFLMRSAGCVINDYADRQVDGHVQRTSDRPLVTGTLTPKAALVGFTLLCAIAFLLVLFTDQRTILLSVGGLILAALYPFMKRHTHLPQLFLGAAFSCSIPMAFSAEADELSVFLWLLYAANLCWTIAYDTYYAMVDRDDDIKIGVKSTAILFGEMDLAMIAALQLMNLGFLFFAGQQFDLGGIFYIGLTFGAAFLSWQLWAARSRSREDCFAVFRQSHWFGVIILIALIFDYGL